MAPLIKGILFGFVIFAVVRCNPPSASLIEELKASHELELRQIKAECDQRVVEWRLRLEKVLDDKRECDGRCNPVIGQWNGCDDWVFKKWNNHCFDLGYDPQWVDVD